MQFFTPRENRGQRGDLRCMRMISSVGNRMFCAKNKGGCDFAATSFVMDSVDFFGVGNRNGVFDVIIIEYINNF